MTETNKLHKFSMLEERREVVCFDFAGLGSDFSAQKDISAVNTWLVMCRLIAKGSSYVRSLSFGEICHLFMAQMAHIILYLAEQNDLLPVLEAVRLGGHQIYISIVKFMTIVRKIHGYLAEIYGDAKTRTVCCVTLYTNLGTALYHDFEDVYAQQKSKMGTFVYRSCAYLRSLITDLMNGLDCNLRCILARFLSDQQKVDHSAWYIQDIQHHYTGAERRNRLTQETIFGRYTEIDA